MKEHYSYDEIYGTLVYQNETDDIRKYFVIDCECYKFIWWMFRHICYGRRKRNCRYEYTYSKGNERLYRIGGRYGKG